MHLTCMRALLIKCLSAVLSIYYLEGILLPPAIYTSVFTCLHILACTQNKMDSDYSFTSALGVWLPSGTCRHFQHNS